MSERSSKPIYQQIGKQLISIVVLLTVLLGFIFFIVFAENSQQNEITSSALKTLQKKYNNQNELLKTYRLTQDILSIQSAQNLIDKFNHHSEQWQRYVRVSNNNRLALTQWQVANKKNHQIVTRLAENSSRNQQLKRNSIIELTLILQSAISLQVNAQPSDNALLDQLKTKVNSLLDAVEQLNLQIPLTQFEQINIQAKALIAEQNNIGKLNNSEDLNSQLNTLNRLLFTEQRMLAKWRGYLRLSNEYLSGVNEGLALLEQNASLLLKPINQTGLKKEKVTKVFGIVLTQFQLKIMFWLLVASLFIFVVILLVRIRTRVSLHSDVNVQLINAMLENKDIAIIETESAESQYLKSQLVNLQAPEFSEKDFYQLKTDMQHQQTVLRQANSIVFWQFEKHYQTFNQTLVDLLLSSAKKSASGQKAKLSWRSYFTKTHVKTLINVAREAKKTAKAKSIQVKTRTGLWVNIVIFSKPSLLFGTIMDSGNIDKLTKKVIDLEADVITQNKLNYQDENAKSYKLNDMLIQAMLQSQRRSFVSNQADVSLQDYRQLTRMLDWLRQYQIISHLKVSAKTLNLSDVHLPSEIQAASLNALCEAHWQKNQLLISCDQQLMTYAKLDARLFQRLILVTVRLLLTEQFNVNCHLTIDVIDQNAGQQIIKFTCLVSLTSTAKTLPVFLKHLLSEPSEKQIVEPEMVRYFKALLQSQHGSNLVIQKLDSGFSLAFDLPIAMANHAKKNESSIKLSQKNIIIVAENKAQESMISEYIKQADGNIICAGADYFTDQLTIDQLIKKPVNALIVSSECLERDLPAIEQRISVLPTRSQPKLMVLQAPYNAPLHQQGFYSQASYPLLKTSFLKQLETLLSGSKASNLLFETEIFTQQQFDTSFVEVLLAVPDPEEHQSLLRLLHWCGLQIRIVSTGHAMKKHWQTGRYLILINAFTESPFVELTTGKTIHRGVFSLSEHEISLTKEQQVISKNWLVDRLPTILALDKLSALLSPWLKTKKSVIEHNKPIQKIISPKSNKTIIDRPIKGKLASNMTVETAFDMLQYSKHQGNAELAVFMLDEYQQSNHRFLSELVMAINTQTSAAAKQALMNLEANAKILAAEDMVNLCHSMQIALNKNDNNLTDQLLEQMAVQVELIDLYAESI